MVISSICNLSHYVSVHMVSFIDNDDNVIYIYLYIYACNVIKIDVASLYLFIYHYYYLWHTTSRMGNARTHIFHQPMSGKPTNF